MRLVIADLLVLCLLPWGWCCWGGTGGCKARIGGFRNVQKSVVSQRYSEEPESGPLDGLGAVSDKLCSVSCLLVWIRLV